MTWINVDQALIQSFLDGGFSLPIAHENIEYTPDGSAYAEITIFDSGTEAFDLADTDERLGVFQVILRYPVDTGAITAKTKAQEIFNHFSIGSHHTYSGQSVEIRSHERGPAAPESGWYKLNLRLNFRAHLPR